MHGKKAHTNILSNYAGVHRQNVCHIAALFFYIVKTSEYQK